jgi:hypothetical protein
MTKPLTPVVVVKGWLVPIATRVANATGDKAKMRAVADSAAIFAGRLPPEAFTDEACNWLLEKPGIEAVPPATMADWLAGWWDERRPRKPGEIPRDIAESNLSSIDQRWATYFRTRREQGALTPALRGVLSLIRREAPEAFDWLLRHDIDAAAVARVAAWGLVADGDHRLRLEWGSEATVRRGVGTCFGQHDSGRETKPSPQNIDAALAMLRAIVGQWGPQNAHLVPASAAAGRDAEAPVFGGEPVFG